MNINAGTSSYLPYNPAIGLQDPALVASILASAVDVTILMTAEGIICEQVIAGADLPRNMFTGWPGKSIYETVTVESRSKIEQLLGEAGNGMPRWRQVNHPLIGGLDIPISYSAVKAGPQGHIIAIGRDMSTVSQLQQRLLSAEQAVEQKATGGACPECGESVRVHRESIIPGHEMSAHFEHLRRNDKCPLTDRHRA